MNPNLFTIEKIQTKYHRKINSIDLDILISFVIKKEREFIMTHPEFVITDNQQSVIGKMIKRRLKNEPLAYILGQKEFYGLNFKVNKNTLIPRPETELMVESALKFIKTKRHENIKESNKKNNEVISHQSSVINIIDIGTGSGNIIISILKNLSIDLKFKIQNSEFFAIDISKGALKIARQNAKKNKVDEKIKFIHGNFLDPFLVNSKFNPPAGGQNSKFLILANLPYLSEEIYKNCPPTVKKYEPRTALYSANQGLAHYEKLLSQIKSLLTDYELPITALMEISPEQKRSISSIIKKYLPSAKIEFKKDLADKWRLCRVELRPQGPLEN